MRDSLSLALAAAAWLCSGCAQKDPAAPAQSSNITNDVEEVVAERFPMASDSGLAVKRGVMQLAPDRKTFRLCDDAADLWVLDQSDGVLQQTFGAAAAETPIALYVEAYGERTSSAEVPQARDYAGVFVLEQVLYAAPHEEVKGCATPAPDYIVAARGTEPFWSAEVRETQIVWREPAARGPAETVLNATHTEDAEGTARYTASGAGRQIEVSIDAQPCRDAMSGEFFAYSARAVVDGRQLSGCARVGR